MKLTRYQNGALQVLRQRLTARRKPAVTTFPMVHVANAAFYARVMEEAETHDLVLYEGVRAGPGRIANAAYRIAAAGRSPLAAQNVAMKCRGRGAKWINSDLPRDRFRTLWSEVPLWQRLLFYGAMPLVGFALRFRRVRTYMVQALARATDTEASADFGPFGKEFKAAVIEARDAHLLEVVKEKIAQGGIESIAIVWGAEHMPPLIKALVYEYGYTTSAREWHTVYVAKEALMDQADENSVSA